MIGVDIECLNLGGFLVALFSRLLATTTITIIILWNKPNCHKSCEIRGLYIVGILRTQTRITERPVWRRLGALYRDEWQRTLSLSCYNWVAPIRSKQQSILLRIASFQKDLMYLVADRSNVESVTPTDDNHRFRFPLLPIVLNSMLTVFTSGVLSLRRSFYSQSMAWYRPAQ